MFRIGVDVGGTNTDAVLMEDSKVLESCKTPTTAPGWIVELWTP